MNKHRVEQLEHCLREQFQPSQLIIRDDSALHAGHASAGGAGHFAVYIVSTAFEGLSRVKRHQAIFSATANLMGSEIHALSIEAKTPLEIENNS